ncbi:MAG: BT_3928 family protein [Bacteroidales bacterium]
MKYLSLLSRMVLGSVFIFSGFVKAVDPLGSAYKFSDYFAAFGMGFLEFLALPLAVILSAFELVLGVTLILGYRRKVTWRVVWWFLLFFTLLTLVLALFNPVSDCGCFGDALILTNWETFLKNVILMLFVLPLYLMRDRENGEEARPWSEWTVIAALFLSVSIFSLWNHAHLPVLDFRPYDVGTLIREEMEIPEGAAVDAYETELVYRNRTTGKTETFSIETYPKDTLEWEFVSSDSRLVSKGYEPPIHDFAIMDQDGNDIVDRILSDKGYSLIMVSHDLTHANGASLLKARDWGQLELLADDFSFYAVTASPSAQVENITDGLDLDYPFYAADEIMLKTVVRSNPGYLLISNGVIVGKWGFRDFPEVADLQPGWSEMIGNASAPMDEESQLLMEAGIYEDFSYGVIDFGQMISRVLFERNGAKQEHASVVIFVMITLLVLVLADRISPVRT